LKNSLKNFLITLGDSFTYGQGLDYFLMKDEYPNSFNLIKENETYSIRHFISSSVVEFDDFRKKNNYSNKLNNKLNTSLITNSENGGSNSKRAHDLEVMFNYLKMEPNMVPKYCVFQLTHSIRDIDDILYDKGQSHIKIYDEEYREKIKQCASGRNWDMGHNSKLEIFDNLYPQIYLKTIDFITNIFKEMERLFSCKCLFFNGLGDVNLIKSFEHNLKSNPYYFELKKGETVYMTLLDLSHKNNLTIRDVLGLSDDHPSLELHDWLSDELYKKLI
jgi:hypothetical protein